MLTPLQLAISFEYSHYGFRIRDGRGVTARGNLQEQCVERRRSSARYSPIDSSIAWERL